MTDAQRLPPLGGSAAALHASGVPAPLRAELRELMPAAQAVRHQVEKAFRGKSEIVELVLVALFSRGHILLEDVPGVGKTTLARALARSVELEFKRIQFTSDLLPSDVIGVSIWNESTRHFELKPGPVFTQVLLADEINRTTPRTQSSLLEAMNERQVTIDSTTYTLDEPFFVIATQNPLEFAGTYPLPESQVDRFVLRTSIGYPDPSFEKEVIREYGQLDPVAGLSPVLGRAELLRIQQAVSAVRVADEVLDYLHRVVLATRQAPQLALGASTRAAMSFFRAVQARSLLQGRDFAIPDDVKYLAAPALAHRVAPLGSTDGSAASRRQAEVIIAELLEALPVPI